MVNHPNRSKRGRPPIAPEDRKIKRTIWLRQDVADAVAAAGPERVDEILRKALLA